MDHASAEQQIDQLARQITRMLLDRPGHLISVQVSHPPDLDGAEIKALLRAHLAESGIDFVDVWLRDEPGPIQLLSATIEPSRSAERSDHTSARGIR